MYVCVRARVILNETETQRNTERIFKLEIQIAIREIDPINNAARVKTIEIN